MQLWRRLVESAKYQIYQSLSHDPFINLSIEHYLLQKTPPHSTVLFLYQNRPCIVIGRNQNPWLEINLGSVKQLPSHDNVEGKKSKLGKKLRPSGEEIVEIVRRRSGGGTVFHDGGNINYSVICPTAEFTRDKHAEMVTRAIRKVNTRARVNERHDIVLDQGSRLDEKDWPDPKDMHRTAYHTHGKTSPPLKVSGSAYKLVRQRALHHGTCLISTTDLPRISRYLDSPARPFIKARGVESVRSPIGNICEDKKKYQQTQDKFNKCVMRAFAEMYEIDQQAWLRFPSRTVKAHTTEACHSDPNGDWATGWVGDKKVNLPEIREGIREMMSPEWIYGQTPQFTLSSHPIEEDDRERPPMAEDFPASARVTLKVKSGVIISSHISISSNPTIADTEAKTFDGILENRSIAEIDDFNSILGACQHASPSEVSAIAKWLDCIFGKSIGPSVV